MTAEKPQHGRNVLADVITQCHSLFYAILLLSHNSSCKYKEDLIELYFFLSQSRIILREMDAKLSI